MIFSLRGAQPDRASRLVRLVFFSGLLSCLAASAGEAPSTPPDLDDAWLRLLHYRGTMESASNSSGPRFFIHPRGASRPRLELEASIEGIRKPGTDFHCRFPARAMLIGRFVTGITMPSSPCPEWEGFRSRMAAAGASLVFSSYYLNNPASAFGHSFLRIHRKFLSNAKPAELLDTGVGYAATVTTQNQLLYGIYGLTGGFAGAYTALPYYYKVREYAEAESRDLWSYELALSESELAMLVAHLWEMDRAELRYFYLGGNCSYEILALIEAVLDTSAGKRPRPGLLSRLPGYVIPAHTLQSLMQEPGLVRRINYRPSQLKTLEARLSTLTPAERGLARDWENRPSAPELGARVLDARIDWIDLVHFKELVREEPRAMGLKQQALAARAGTGVVMRDLIQLAPTTAEPSSGHRPRRIGLALGARLAQADPASPFAELSYRPALHDLLDPGTAYPDSAVIEFINLSARIEANRFSIPELTLFRSQSIPPAGTIHLVPSWKVELELDDLVPHFLAGGGLTLGILEGAQKLRAYALAGGRLEAGAGAGLWSELGLHARLGERAALMGSAGWSLFPGRRESRQGIGLRTGFGRDFALGAAIERREQESTWKSGIYYYY